MLWSDLEAGGNICGLRSHEKRLQARRRSATAFAEAASTIATKKGGPLVRAAPFLSERTDQAKLTTVLRRRIDAPTRAKPPISMSQVAGSGTAGGGATMFRLIQSACSQTGT
jgi:hypothetical protein